MHINKEHKNFAIMQKFVLGLEKIIYPWYYILDNNKIQGEYRLDRELRTVHVCVPSLLAKGHGEPMKAFLILEDGHVFGYSDWRR